MLITPETPVQDPIAAVTHPDPYPFYRRLLAEHPLYYDHVINTWVATSAEMVRAVLTSSLCRVRPNHEPVPKPLVGSPVGTVFNNLVRMNDGDHHHLLKGAVNSTLVSLDEVKIGQLAGLWAKRLVDQCAPDKNTHGLTDFCFQLPVYVVGSLLGLADDQLKQTVLWVGQYVAGVSPAATAEVIEEGKVAANHLLDQFHTLLRSPDSYGLLQTLASQMHRIGDSHSDRIAANGIGFLSQAYEATAGLIGNTLVKLARDHALRQQVQLYPDCLKLLVQEILRFDSPVQNTRRFVAESGNIAGQEMQAEDRILVVLAAANHDHAVNPHPDHFDIFRKTRQIFTFGTGAHACPGERLATTIAIAGVRQLIEINLPLERLVDTHYRASSNVRIPFFQ